MTTELPYKWEDIQRYFPKEIVAELRRKMLEERATGEHSDRALMEKYRMTKQTFYNTVKRYRLAQNETDFMDKSKAPKHPARKVGVLEKEKIREIVQKDQERLEK